MSGTQHHALSDPPTEPSAPNNCTAALPTVGAIAVRFGVAVHRVEYVIRAHRIAPMGRAGNARVFSEDAVRRIGELLRGERLSADDPGPQP